MPVTGSANQTGSFHQNKQKQKKKNIVQEEKRGQGEQRGQTTGDRTGTLPPCCVPRTLAKVTIGPSHKSVPRGKLSQTFLHIVLGSMCLFLLVFILNKVFVIVYSFIHPPPPPHRLHPHHPASLRCAPLVFVYSVGVQPLGVAA